MSLEYGTQGENVDHSEMTGQQDLFAVMQRWTKVLSFCRNLYLVILI